MKNVAIVLCSWAACATLTAELWANEPAARDRWTLNASGGITWAIDGRIPHSDHIEMSGEQISAVLRYGVNAEGAFTLERSFVWPMLRTIPNDTHASLMRRFRWTLPEDMLMVNGRKVESEKVKSISQNGVMTVVSELSCSANGRVELTRHLFPSPAKAVFCEKYVLRNVGQTPLSIEAPESRSVIRTEKSKGVDGEYVIEAFSEGKAGCTLHAGDSLVLHAGFQAYRSAEQRASVDTEQELKERRSLISSLRASLVLETPDSTINTMFSFAKIRAAESIYKTKGGYMHGPGGEAYYAAIWANDQAEYINPFFPFLGYEKGVQSALNAFRHFARFMNDEYKLIPSSIVAEGTDSWNGAGDRGDASMVAYGAARYALARGDVREAEELWPLISWCLEYCRRNLNDDGVVASDSDELEGRFPAGKANLCTSSLYYDALLSAAYLGENLQKPRSQVSAYTRQAQALRAAIERHFGGEVEGFNTYRYYQGNDVLRSWICIPLTVGINDRKDETIRALFSPRLWTKNGLLTQAGSETFWDRTTLYALRGIYACGETEKATSYLKYYSRQRLLGEHVPYAIEAWPEGNQRHLSAESGLYARIITEGLFGVRPVGLHAFTVTPRLPKEWNEMVLRNICAFGKAPFDLRVARHPKGVRLEVCRNGKPVIVHTGKEGKTFTINNLH
ncbi:MAG: hypothetical protein LBH84_01515 [Prevotellaceae bacterium]|jgi:hypothetical protein|nr:hypothetical protein [Prevotellaceae bacterium]